MDRKPMAEIRKFMEDMANPLEIEIVDVEWNDKDASLTVLIDSDNGVDLDLCEKFSNAIEQPLDDFDPTFGQPYTLNVSSPGLDRAFKTDRDFQKALNTEVEVRLYSPLKGKKFLEGVLTAYDGNTITLLMDGAETKIQLNKVAKVNKAIKFE